MAAQRTRPGQVAQPDGGSLHSGLQRETTDRAVLATVDAEQGPLSRAEIARRTGLSPPAVSEAVRRLETGGILHPVGMSSGQAGAAATLYDLAPSAGLIVAVEVEPGTVHAAAADLTGRTLVTVDRPLDASPGELGGRVDALVADVLDEVGPDRATLRAVAVSVANPVDPATGSVISVPESAFPAGVLAATDIRGDPRTTVLVDNDVNLAALAERDHGAAADARTFAYLFVGRGRNVGLGLVVDGEILRGAHGLAGEIGYLPAAGGSGAAGPSRFALAAAIAEYDLVGTDPSADTLARAGRILGEAAGAVCAVVDPELIVLGGPGGGHPDLLAHVRDTVAAIAPGPTAVLASTTGDRGPLQGALVLARRAAWSQLPDPR